MRHAREASILSACMACGPCCLLCPQTSLLLLEGSPDRGDGSVSARLSDPTVVAAQVMAAYGRAAGAPSRVAALEALLARDAAFTVRRGESGVCIKCGRHVHGCQMLLLVPEQSACYQLSQPGTRTHVHAHCPRCADDGSWPPLLPWVSTGRAAPLCADGGHRSGRGVSRARQQPDPRAPCAGLSCAQQRARHGPQAAGGCSWTQRGLEPAGGGRSEGSSGRP
jgi:ferredoxin